MKKSISGFTLGLIGNLWVFVVSIITIIITTATINAFSDPLFIENQNINVAPLVLNWIMLIGTAIGIAGAVLCLKKSRIGGILLAFSLLTIEIFFIYILCIIEKTSTLMLITIMLFFLIPGLLIIISIIFAFLAKEKEEELITKQQSEETRHTQLINDIEDYFKYNNDKDTSLVFNKSISKNYNFETIKNELVKNNYFLTKNNEEWIITKTISEK